MELDPPARVNLDAFLATAEVILEQNVDPG